MIRPLFVQLLVTLLNILYAYMRPRYFLYLLAFLYFFSCEPHHVRRNLAEAEMLLLSDPDSAMTILNGICEKDLCTDKMKAQYCLLAIMVKY